MNRHQLWPGPAPGFFYFIVPLNRAGTSAHCPKTNVGLSPFLESLSFSSFKHSHFIFCLSLCFSLAMWSLLHLFELFKTLNSSSTIFPSLYIFLSSFQALEVCFLLFFFITSLVFFFVSSRFLSRKKHRLSK